MITQKIDEGKEEEAFELAKLKYPTIPEAVLHSFISYYIHKHALGSFCMACLENNLSEAFHRGDENSLASLKEIVTFLYWDFPAYCWGSKEKVDKFLGDE
uniref:Uncharacterized protein n=1 Tax=viral metagenome TaxID=1070528 RepID=A0A6M3LK67_9ZZZZ